MDVRLLTQIDAALQRRARANAAAAVSDCAVHASQRREAARAVAAVGRPVVAPRA